MFSKRSLRAISSSEKQLPRAYRLRQRQCVRCFHASQSQSANERSNNGKGESTNEGARITAQKQSRTRHQRSATISTELSMLQKGPPPSGDISGPGSVTGAYHAPPKALGANSGFTETPNGVGGPRMGDNVSAGREGPNAQGIGRPIRYEDRSDGPQDNTLMTRGKRTPNAVDEPAEGGAGVMGGSSPNPGHHQEWIERSGRSDKKEEGKDDIALSDSQRKQLRSRLAKSKALGTPFRPSQPSREDFLRNPQATATVGSANFEGVILDRLRPLLIPTSTSTRMLPHKWNQIDEQVKNLLVTKLVRGLYDQEHENIKHPVLGRVLKQLMHNGTYHEQDEKLLLEKIRSFLPSLPPAAKPATPPAAADGSSTASKNSEQSKA